jgi:hypothetical protein
MTADRTGAEVTNKGLIHRDIRKFRLIRQLNDSLQLR